MELLIPPPEVVPFGLRALKMVAVADGEFGDRERALLMAAQRMFGTDHDVDALAPITPAELAAALPDNPVLRKQLVFAMLVLSLADGEASPEEAKVVASFRDALGVDAHEVDTFRKVADGQLTMARLDVMRRFWARDHVVTKLKEKGGRWLVRAIATFAKLADDPKLAAEYQALETYPEGTLGREYARFMRDNGFSMPGEKGGAPEVIIIHDLTHVLSGYGTDAAGEICVTAFHAGYRRKEPFTWILFSMMQFNLGIGMTPLAETARLQFDAPRALEALRRGAAMNADLTDGSWDYRADMKLPLAEVRAKYGIAPLATA
jgi:tellurite resistance protein